MSGLGRYTLVRQIGRGGMAEIWKAKATGPSGFVKFLAVKTILPEIAEDRVFSAMFVDEAKLEATLVHPNLIQVFDFGEMDGRLFLAMEYIAGANVDRLLNRLHKEGTALPADLALYIALEVCRGLGYAHGKTDSAGTSLGVVHRDISPHNILVSTSGEVKVGDFGIARVASVVPRTAAGQVRGKLAYMSPEQLGNASLDGRSDLFSLGVVIYEMVTGKRLFGGTSSDLIYDQVNSFDPVAHRDLSVVPDEIRGVLVKLLQHDRAARHRDAQELEVELANLLGLAGINRARHRLAALVSRLFQDEIDADADDETAPVDRTEPDLGQANATVASPSPHPGRSAIATVPAAPAPVAAAIAKGTASRAATVRPARPRRRLAVGVVLGVVVVGVGLVGWRLVASRGPGGPPRGGIIRIAIAEEIENFDVFSSELSLTRTAMGSVIEPLMHGAMDGDLEPWVIDRTELADGARTVILHLRPGVFFHDHPCLPGGHERVAIGADVAYSIRQAIRLGGLALPIRGAAAYRGGGPGADLGITAVGDTVTLALSEPAPFYEAQIAEVRLLPHELDGCEDLRRMRQPVGTGPFRFTAPPHGARMRLARAPHYWHHAANGAQLPYVDGVEISGVDEMTDVLARIGRGELEIAMPPRDSWDRYVDLSDDRPRMRHQYEPLGLEVAKHASRTWVALVCLFVTAAKGPLADVHVRAALARVLDRPALVPSSVLPLSAPNARFFDARMLGYDAALPGVPFDVAAARAELVAAGHPEGAGLPAITLGTLREQKLADAIAAQAAQIGLQVSVVTIPGARAGEAIEKGTVDALLVTDIWGLKAGENVDLIGEVNRVAHSATLDTLQRELSGTPERADRGPIYKRIEQALLAELPVIPIAWGDVRVPLEVFVLSKAVHGFHDVVTGYGRLDELEQTWLVR